MARTTTPARILAVTTSTSSYEPAAGYRTGLWLGELTHAYDVFLEAGHEVTVASIAGGEVPIDPESLQKGVIGMGDTDKRYEDPEFMRLLADSPSVRDLSADDFDAIYLTGGHGTMFDFSDPALVALVSAFAAQDKIVSAVCHGPAGLIHATAADGQPLVAGKKVTGFSMPEEKLAQRAEVIPFVLQDELKAKGAKYSKALVPFKSKVVTDGLLVTGQNPTSAADVAKAVLKVLKKKG
ncbi:MAG: type 1 glutamine amidotransferase domain-containing protein [Micrococcales bacterium]|nr:type 1 glutamine amidotransferase domain-containing protein [Micrococcales bacterium]